MRYKVTDPKGITLEGEHFAEGKLLPASVGGERLNTWRHFEQVAPAEDADEKAKAKAEAKAKADAEKAEAEAKAKAEADAAKK